MLKEVDEALHPLRAIHGWDGNALDDLIRRLTKEVVASRAPEVAPPPEGKFCSHGVPTACVECFREREEQLGRSPGTPSGPWQADYIGEIGRWVVRCPVQTLGNTANPKFIVWGLSEHESEALAVRDALNRVSGLGEPTP